MGFYELTDDEATLITLLRGHISPQMLHAIVTTPGILPTALALLPESLPLDRVAEILPDLTITPEEQIQNLHRWNKAQGWNLSPETFDALGPAPLPPAPGTIVVLAFYVGSDPKQQFRRYREVLHWVYQRKMHCPTHDWPHRYAVIQHKTGEVQPLCWEVIDVTGETPDDSRPVATFGVLAALAHFPQWGKCLGTKLPVIVPGYTISLATYSGPFALQWGDGLFPSLCHQPLNRLANGLGAIRPRLISRWHDGKPLPID